MAGVRLYLAAATFEFSGHFWVHYQDFQPSIFQKILNGDVGIRDVLNLCLNIDLKHMYYKSSYSKVIV